jgi:hypothetical protein
VDIPNKPVALGTVYNAISAADDAFSALTTLFGTRLVSPNAS